MPASIPTHRFDALTAQVFPDRVAMGRAAAEDVARHLRACLRVQDEARVVFAAAPSQDDFLAALVEHDLAWDRVVAFQMDEYLGLPNGHEATFAAYLQRHVIRLVPLKTLHALRLTAGDPEAECTRYAALLNAAPLDVVCLGIGENGHLAFNDPPVADFEDPASVKVVTLDLACRQQQVHDGCFPSLADVPTQALTLTIPALLRGARLSVVVPGAQKAQAVHDTLVQPISTACPASILRRQASAYLYVDEAAFHLVAPMNRPAA
ncbi:MAG: 6-phosphogluconolactonase [Bacteroidota bacterium]